MLKMAKISCFMAAQFNCPWQGCQST